MEVKTCSKCKVEKPLSDFNVDKSRKLGVTSACKVCRHPNIKLPKQGFKFCTICKEEKESFMFYKCSANLTGFSSSCKLCQKEKRDAKVNDECATTPIYKVCTSCKIEKDSSMFYVNNRAKDLLSSHCKDCKKDYNIKVSEETSKKRKEYYKNNHQRIKDRRNYLNSINEQKQILKSENAIKARNSKRLVSIKKKVKNLISSSFKRACNGGYKKSKNTEFILGCTPLEFKRHIEKQFLNWMSWDNHGNGCTPLEYNCSWDLDHIIPISYAKTEEEVYLLNHWSNIQPLCSKINRYDKKEKVIPITNLELKITINN